jgi:RNA polymerase sigma-70 factor, ECF subfamily
VSSSFPAARFPSLALTRGREQAAEERKGRAESAEPSDETLIARICQDDKEALAVLFNRYARMVWSIAERILRNRAEADDLVQDVFLLIHKKAWVFDSSKGAPRSLIALMTYQRAFTRRRYLAARHCPAPVEAEERAAALVAPAAVFYDQTVEAHLGRERLRKVLNEMSEDQRETIRLYFFEGYTLSEIAVQLGQSVGNVKHHYYRGLDKFRRNVPPK